MTNQSKALPAPDKIPSLTLRPCDCENKAHFFSKGTARAMTPCGNPGHKYRAQFFNVETVMTERGPFNLCKDCREDCHASR